MTLLYEIPQNLGDGLTIALTGYSIVFAALVVLFYVFNNLSKFMVYRTKKHLAKTGKLKNLKDDEISVTGETLAAISMALYLHTQLHDDESGILTIKKVSRNYSPWSSKIYGLRNFNK